MCTHMMTYAVENIIDIWDAYIGQRKGRFPHVSLNVVGMCFHPNLGDKKHHYHI